MTLTTTSYALLGLLSLRPHTAYDLAQQASRSLAFVWQVSDSQLYEHPKRLVDLGLVRSKLQPAGPRRSRTLYEITAAGRRALRDWLSTSPAEPRWEDEVLLRIMVADHAGPAELLATIEDHRSAVLDQFRRGQARIREQLDGTAPYPERASLNVLWWTYCAEQMQTRLAWLDRIEAEVSTWSSTTPRPFDERTRKEAERLASLRPEPTAATRHGAGSGTSG